jgi:hypothetical protein
MHSLTPHACTAPRARLLNSVSSIADHQLDAEENPLTVLQVEPLSAERREHYANLVDGFPGKGERS